MELKDIIITSLSITSNQDGSENLYIGVTWGAPGAETFYTKAISKPTITVQHLMDALGSIGEQAGVK